MQLRIPETILFEQGRPVKWLGTGADGRVMRRSLDVSGSRSFAGQSGFTVTFVGKLGKVFVRVL
jgi:hypothetical protein